MLEDESGIAWLATESLEGAKVETDQCTTTPHLPTLNRPNRLSPAHLDAALMVDTETPGIWHLRGLVQKTQPIHDLRGKGSGPGTALF